MAWEIAVSCRQVGIAGAGAAKQFVGFGEVIEFLEESGEIAERLGIVWLEREGAGKSSDASGSLL